MRFFFENSCVKKQFAKLKKQEQERVERKLVFWFSQKNPLDFATQMVGFSPPLFRFRIGYLRVCGRKINNDFIILLIGRRDQIYRKFF